MTPAEEYSAWVEAARSVEGFLATWDDLRPAEALVMDVHNPAPDLQRRAMQWSHEFRTGELPELLAFGAGLVRAEVEAGDREQPDIMTRARDDRRFLLGDRVLHWAVPWLDAAGAGSVLAALLQLGDHHRPEPELTGSEGLTVPGEDCFGSLVPAPLSSLLCGGVVFDSTAGEWGTTRAGLRAGVFPAKAREWLQQRAERWERLRADHPGSAAFWRDLARRARVTAGRG